METIDAVAAIVTIIAFLYLLIWGEHSVREILETHRKKREQTPHDAVASELNKPARVFLSYSRKDLVFVERLAWDLKAAGLDVWYDLSGLEVGSRWGREIQNAITQSQYFVVVLSPNSVASDWVEREFLYADNLKRKVVPLLYSPCDMPLWLIDLQYIDVQGKKYKENFDRLLKALGVGCAKPASDTEKPVAPELAISTPKNKKEAPEGAKPAGQRGVKVRRVLAGVAVLAILLSAGLIFGRPQWLCSIMPKLCLTPTPTPTATPVSVTALDPSIQKALNEIENKAPLYKTGCDQLDSLCDETTSAYGPEKLWDSIGNVAILNGRIIASSQDIQLDGVSLTTQLSDSFAATFEFKVEAYGGGCAFMASNNEFKTPRFSGFDLYFRDDGFMELNRNELWGDSYPVAISSSQFKFYEYNTITVIVLGDKISVFINGLNAVNNFDPKPTVDYSVLRIGSYDSGECEFDGFKVWNLRDVIPSSTEIPTAVAAGQMGTPARTPMPVASLDPSIRNALDEIANKAPLYKTGFDYWDDFWQSNGNVKIENGVFVASAALRESSSVQERLLTTDKLAVVFDFRLRSAKWDDSSCEFMATNGLFETKQWKGFDLMFHRGNWVELGRNRWPTVFERITTGSTFVNYSDTNTVTLIILGNQIAVFVNGQLALTATDPYGSTIITEQDIGAYNDTVCEFDNFKLWDLTALNP